MERNISRQVLQDRLIHHSSITLALLVLGVDSVLGLFDARIFELFKVVVFVTLILIFLIFLLIIDEGKSLVMDGDFVKFALL